MHPGWSGDFSYTYFRQLLHTARRNFSVHRLSEAPGILRRDGSPRLFLRHDIKISLQKALRVAEIEHEYGLPATFMVRADSPLYSLNERNSRIQLLELLQMGHEVGLHFDLSNDNRQNLSFLRIVDMQTRKVCERIEQIICRPVRSISFHRPILQLSNGPLLVAGRINADAQELRARCLSDAEGLWRGGEPVARLSQPENAVVQLILHPIWWGEKHVPASQRLQTFFELTTGDKVARDASIFDIELAKTIPAVRRQGIYELVGGGNRI